MLAMICAWSAKDNMSAIVSCRYNLFVTPRAVDGKVEVVEVVSEVAQGAPVSNRCSATKVEYSMISGSNQRQRQDEEARAVGDPL